MDKYDEQINRLTKNPRGIYGDWFDGKGLFDFAERGKQNLNCGCLTMIREGGYYAFIHGRINEELTEKIRSDERIPKSREDIELKHLPVFAEYQRLIDKMEGVENK